MKQLTVSGVLNYDESLISDIDSFIGAVKGYCLPLLNGSDLVGELILTDVNEG